MAILVRQGKLASTGVSHNSSNLVDKPPFRHAGVIVDQLEDLLRNRATEGDENLLVADADG